MRLIDEVTLAALDGSRPTDRFTVWAWRGDSLVIPDPLDVLSWSSNDDAGDAVKINQKMSLVVADPDGKLGAWRLDDPLGVAGSKLQFIYRVGGAGAVNYAWFRIVSNEPDELVEWREIDEYGYEEPDAVTEPHKRLVPITTGVVRLSVVDLTFNSDEDRFESPESPPAAATILSEAARLTANYYPTVVDEGVEDTPISRQTIYDRERLESVQDILARVSARYRMGGDGECHIYPTLTAPVWRADPGKSLVSVSRKQSIDGLYNRWVVSGKESEDGQPIRAVVSITNGPLRFGGPHGRKQFFYTSEMIEKYDQAENYARKLRDEFLATLAVELDVSIVPRPELQGGDRIEVGYPIAAQRVAYFPGVITSIRRSGDPIPTSTTLKVSCSYADVLAALSRTDWSQHITGTMPALTWDRMPGTWGTAPPTQWNELP